jgi:DNA-binding MarR family transcriptional regulator
MNNEGLDAERHPIDAVRLDYRASSLERPQGVEFIDYMTQVAEARYVMRKVLRILDECARQYGLEALEHQALLQIAGTPGRPMPIHKLAARLDIVPAFGSRLVKQLEAKGLISRSDLKDDKRVTLTAATEKGVQLLEQISDKIHYEIAHFQRRLTAQERASAMAIFAFYLGHPIELVRMKSPTDGSDSG